MISQRARCALHAVAFLASRGSDSPVILAEIRAYLRTYSRQLAFSAAHLSKILQSLCSAGILRALPGRGGGYVMARPAAEIPVLEIVQAIDGKPEEQCCLLSIGKCDSVPSCGVFHIVHKAESLFYDSLASETAESLARKMFHGRAPD